MTDELEMIEKEAVVACFRVFSDIYMEGLRNPTKNISQDRLSMAPNSNQGSPDLKAEVRAASW